MLLTKVPKNIPLDFLNTSPPYLPETRSVLPDKLPLIKASQTLALDLPYSIKAP